MSQYAARRDKLRRQLRKLELDSRREVGLIITNPAVSRRMMEVFKADWESSASKKEREKDVEAADEPARATA